MNYIDIPGTREPVQPDFRDPEIRRIEGMMDRQGLVDNSLAFAPMGRLMQGAQQGMGKLANNVIDNTYGKAKGRSVGYKPQTGGERINKYGVDQSKSGQLGYEYNMHKWKNTDVARRILAKKLNIDHVPNPKPVRGQYTMNDKPMKNPDLATAHMNMGKAIGQGMSGIIWGAISNPNDARSRMMNPFGEYEQEVDRSMENQPKNPFGMKMSPQGLAVGSVAAALHELGFDDEQ